MKLFGDDSDNNEELKRQIYLIIFGSLSSFFYNLEFKNEF